MSGGPVFFIVLVLYNRVLTACETWDTFLKDSCGEADIRIMAADNSMDREILERNRELAGKYGIRHLDMGGNTGLSKAYNRAVREIAFLTGEETGCSRCTWVILADQDTVFPESYMTAVRAAAETADAVLLAPVVKAVRKSAAAGGPENDTDRHISPCRRKGMRFVPDGCRDFSKEDLSEYYFINSGLVISADLLLDKQIAYDESLFLDFIDFDLENQIRKRGAGKAAVLPDTVLLQRFSGTEDRTAEQDLIRFRQYRKDGAHFYGKWYAGNPFGKAVLFGRALKLAWKHRDSRFLKKT